MIDLEQELRAAQRLAMDPHCAVAFDFSVDVAGAGYIEVSGATYTPTLEGDPAVIIAAEAGGELIDLVACRLADRAVATRRGLAAILGEDAVEAARLHDHPLLIYKSPLHWASAGCLGAVVLDWRAVPWTLAGVSTITCATPDLEERLRHAFAVSRDFPALTSAEVRHAA